MSFNPRRVLGRSGIEVSPLGMGCWAIGGNWKLIDLPAGWGDVDDSESIRAIHAAMSQGITFFDTAANYGTGHSERILGQALAGRRPDVVVATKFGFIVDEAEKRVTRYRTNEEVVKSVRSSCEASLKRLGTDFIDLFQFHVWDYPPGLAVAVRDELESLVKEGKIRCYAWSTDDPERARVFAEGEHCAAVQHDLNVVMDAPEILSLCERQNLASVNRSPLARGALTGKYRPGVVFAENDVRREAWSMSHFFEPSFEKLEAIRDILTSEGRSLAQGALAWVLTRSERTLPIPGFRTVQQVEENAKTISFGPLSAGQMEEIERLLGRV
jgi:aryl-alcohol dehydrogenase-like predicted oxidoreductase